MNTLGGTMGALLRSGSIAAVLLELQPRDRPRSFSWPVMLDVFGTAMTGGGLLPISILMPLLVYPVFFQRNGTPAVPSDIGLGYSLVGGTLSVGGMLLLLRLCAGVGPSLDGPSPATSATGDRATGGGTDNK